MIDELERRKDTFDLASSAPVRLADGQLWHFPKPWLEVRPLFRRGVAGTTYRVLTCGAELDRLIEAMSESDDLEGQVAAAATLAAHLLLFQYDLADSDLDQLLAFRLGDETSCDWMRDVFAIAVGRSGPKAWRAGGD
jgi:hypothetical protein